MCFFLGALLKAGSKQCFLGIDIFQYNFSALFPILIIFSIIIIISQMLEEICYYIVNLVSQKFAPNQHPQFTTETS